MPKTIDRQKTYESDDASAIGCVFTVVGSGVKVSCPAWRLFMPDIADTDSSGKARPKADVQAEFEKAKEVALKTVSGLPAGARFLLVHGINARTGDAMNTTEDPDPAKIGREDFARVCRGEATMRSGAGDPTVEMWRDIVIMDARLTLGLNKTNATAAVKDEVAKTVKAIAAKKSLSIDAYRANVDGRVSAALGLDA